MKNNDLEKFIAKWKPMVVKGILNHCKDYEHIEDIFHDCVFGMIKAFNDYNINEYKMQKTMYLIGKRRAINYMYWIKYGSTSKLKYIDRFEQLNDYHISIIPDPNTVDVDEFTDDTFNIYYEYLTRQAKLNILDAQILLLRTIAGMTQEEITKYVGLSKSYICKLSQRAVQRAKDFVEVA